MHKENHAMSIIAPRNYGRRRSIATTPRLKAAQSVDIHTVAKPALGDRRLIALHEDDAAQGWLPTQIQARRLARPSA